MIGLVKKEKVKPGYGIAAKWAVDEKRAVKPR